MSSYVNNYSLRQLIRMIIQMLLPYSVFRQKSIYYHPTVCGTQFIINAFLSQVTTLFFYKNVSFLDSCLPQNFHPYTPIISFCDLTNYCQCITQIMKPFTFTSHKYSSMFNSCLMTSSNAKLLYFTLNRCVQLIGFILSK